jgi:hypothetical protein
VFYTRPWYAAAKDHKHLEQARARLSKYQHKATDAATACSELMESRNVGCRKRAADDGDVLAKRCRDDCPSATEVCDAPMDEATCELVAQRDLRMHEFEKRVAKAQWSDDKIMKPKNAWMHLIHNGPDGPTCTHDYCDHSIHLVGFYESRYCGDESVLQHCERCHDTKAAHYAKKAYSVYMLLREHLDTILRQEHHALYRDEPAASIALRQSMPSEWRAVLRPDELRRDNLEPDTVRCKHDGCTQPVDRVLRGQPSVMCCVTHMPRY